jgi:hypothetical protein
LATSAALKLGASDRALASFCTEGIFGCLAGATTRKVRDCSLAVGRVVIGGATSGENAGGGGAFCGGGVVVIGTLTTVVCGPAGPGTVTGTGIVPGDVVAFAAVASMADGPCFMTA